MDTRARASAGSLGIVRTMGLISRVGPVCRRSRLPRSPGCPEERLVVEVRVRAGGGVDDGMRAVDELELLVVPGRPLRSLVLAVADGDRPARERLARVLRIEVELDHLPVAFVRVVPVVEDVVEPVLQRELPREARIRRHVRVHGRRRSLRHASSPSLVAASRVEGVPGEVEVSTRSAAVRGRGRRRDLHEVSTPRPAQRHGRGRRRERRRRSARTARPGRTPLPASRA